MQKLLDVAIMAGGAGTRLWPLSRQNAPKQFLPIFDGRSLFEITLERLTTPGFPAMGRCFVFCAANQAARAARLAHAVCENARICKAKPKLPVAQLHCEPLGRNTAACVALSCLAARAQGDDRPILFLPADHFIADPQAFAKAVGKALPAANAGYLVLFGITPRYASTEYGYIKREPACTGHDAASMPSTMRKAAGYIEKPDAARAARLNATGDYFWNSGMFLAKPSLFLAEFRSFAPDILESAHAAFREATQHAHKTAYPSERFAAIPSVSFDRAVGEKSSNLALLPVEMGWSDVGSWKSLAACLPKNAEGNFIHGLATLTNCRDCLLFADNERRICVQDIRDTILVDAPDALLVMKKPH